VPVAYPTGWATRTEYHVRNSGYKAGMLKRLSNFVH
jgi:hypothetical protein